MKLDRNANGSGLGKYALIKWRNYRLGDTAVDAALRTLDEAGMLDLGTTPETEFFVIRLKDKHAGAALTSYAISAGVVDTEYGDEVMQLAERSGWVHPSMKDPD